jgi:hypothetical protein
MGTLHAMPQRRVNPRIEKMRTYVVARLRAELADGTRGAQSRVARELKIATSHLSNMLADPPTRHPGEEVLRKAASRWGMTYAELESAACGEARAASPVLDERLLHKAIVEAVREVFREELPRLLADAAPKRRPT